MGVRDRVGVRVRVRDLCLLHLHHLQLHVRRQSGEAARIERRLQTELRQALQPAWLAHGGHR